MHKLNLFFIHNVVMYITYMQLLKNYDPIDLVKNQKTLPDDKIVHVYVRDELRVYHVPELIPTQIIRIQKLLHSIVHNNACFDFSETGTGKTYTTIFICKILDLTPFIICPPVIIFQWQNLCDKFELDATVMGYEKLKAGNTPYLDKTKYKKGHIMKWKNVDKYNTIIYDEAHYLRNLTSQNSKIALKCPMPIKILLTATPFEHAGHFGVMGLYANLFNKKEFYKWTFKYGAGFNGFGGALAYSKSPYYTRKLNALLYDRKHPLAAKTKLSEVKDMQPLITENFYVRLSEADLSEYNKISQECINYIEILQHKEMFSIDRRAKLIHALHKIETKKISCFGDLIKFHLNEGRSVIVFTQFRSSIEFLQELFPTGKVLVGGMKRADREATICSFQANKTRLLLATIASGGVGLSLHDIEGTSPRIILTVPVYNAVIAKQAMGRVQRVGGKTPSFIKNVLVQGSKDEDVYEAMSDKIRATIEITDPDL